MYGNDGDTALQQFGQRRDRRKKWFTGGGHVKCHLWSENRDLLLLLGRRRANRCRALSVSWVVMIAVCWLRVAMPWTIRKTNRINTTRECFAVGRSFCFFGCSCLTHYRVRAPRDDEWLLAQIYTIWIHRCLPRGLSHVLHDSILSLKFSHGIGHLEFTRGERNVYLLIVPSCDTVCCDRDTLPILNRRQFIFFVMKRPTWPHLSLMRWWDDSKRNLL